MVGVLVAAASVGAFYAIKDTVHDQNIALLDTQAGQVTQLVQVAISQVGQSLPAIDAVAQATGSSPSAFEAQAAPLTKMPGQSVAVVRAGRVVLARGKGLSVGEVLPAPLAAAVQNSTSQLFSTDVLHIGSQQVIAFVVGGGPTGTAVIDLSVVHPAVTAPTASGPYTHINLALYATPTARPDQLIVTTARPLPLAAPVVDTFLPIGTSKWLVVTSAKTPLAGTWPNAFPWILLVVGLVLALLLGALFEIIGRRERYAIRLVEERTSELEASQRELVRSERLSAVGEMATMIGHELRNPLGASINGLFLARSRLAGHDDPELERHLDLVERETNRAAELCEDLTAFMRERAPQIADLDLRDVVEEVLEVSPPPTGVDVSIPDAGVEVEADRMQLVQILTNLVTNSYQAMPSGGSLRIAGSRHEDFAEIVVEDSGVGIDAGSEEKAFEPFFSTKPVGTGLGLAIVKRLAETHNGTATIHNAPAGGAQVTVRLPLTSTGARS